MRGGDSIAVCKDKNISLLFKLQKKMEEELIYEYEFKDWELAYPKVKDLNELPPCCIKYIIMTVKQKLYKCNEVLPCWTDEYRNGILYFDKQYFSINDKGILLKLGEKFLLKHGDYEMQLFTDDEIPDDVTWIKISETYHKEEYKIYWSYSPKQVLIDIRGA